MRLKFQIGSGEFVPVVGGLKYRAKSEGVLKLFCADGKTHDNKGKICVLIRTCKAFEAAQSSGTVEPVAPVAKKQCEGRHGQL